MAKLKSVVDKLDDVPEAFRSLYVEQNGKFVLDAEGVEDVSGLKSALERLKKEAKDAKDALAKYKGADPDKIAELVAAAEDAERKKAQAEGNWEKREAQLQDQFKKEKDKLDGRIGKLEKALHRSGIQREAIAAITKLEGSATLLLPHVERQLKLIEEDDEFAVVVIDGKGNVRIKDTAGSRMSVDDLVTEMKSQGEFAGAFKGTGASGSGSRAGGGGGGGGGGSAVRRDDEKGFLANLEKIASGKTKVE